MICIFLWWFKEGCVETQRNSRIIFLYDNNGDKSKKINALFCRGILRRHKVHNSSFSITIGKQADELKVSSFLYNPDVYGKQY